MPWGLTPLYAVLHESIYCQGAASMWAANRIRYCDFQAEFDAVATARAGKPVCFTGPWISFFGLTIPPQGFHEKEVEEFVQFGHLGFHLCVEWTAFALRNQLGITFMSCMYSFTTLGMGIPRRPLWGPSNLTTILQNLPMPQKQSSHSISSKDAKLP